LSLGLRKATIDRQVASTAAINGILFPGKFQYIAADELATKKNADLTSRLRRRRNALMTGWLSAPAERVAKLTTIYRARSVKRRQIVEIVERFVFGNNVLHKKAQVIAAPNLQVKQNVGNRAQLSETRR
jgi:hypothetical protein